MSGIGWSTRGLKPLDPYRATGTLKTDMQMEKNKHNKYYTNVVGKEEKKEEKKEQKIKKKGGR